MNTPDFAISARWRNRRPTTQAMARRFDAMVEALASIHPAFNADWVWLKDDGIPYASIRGTLAAAIEAGKVTWEDETPWPDAGYRFTILDKWRPGTAPSLELSLSDGWLEPQFWRNVATISSLFPKGLDPSVMSYEVIRAAMLTACEIFDADSCRAYTTPLTEFDKPGACKIGWMTYIGREPAPLITPPPHVIVEDRPNGGLFMAATREMFDVEDPAHMAAAHDIFAAIRPYNEWAMAQGYG